MNLPEDLSAALAAAAPRLGVFGRRVEWRAAVSSTNDVAARCAADGAAEGTTVIAGEQTAGRGRLGRTWASPDGAGLYVSTVLRPPSTLTHLVTLTAGVAAADGIEAATGLAPTLKWPNDVYVSGRKLAGILAEGGSSAGGSYIVLGFGINVLLAALPPDIAGRATSLEAELGRAVDRGSVLAECLAALAVRYGDLCASRTATIVAAWRRRAAPMLQRTVEWDVDRGIARGVAEDIDDWGALLVRTSDRMVRLTSGEVRWV